MALSESDRGAKALLYEFKRGLAESGWTDGSNILMDVRWTGGDVDVMRKFAKELVTLNPDVILANSTPVTLALQREHRQSQSYSQLLATRLARASLPVWLTQVETSRDWVCLKHQ